MQLEMSPPSVNEPVQCLHNRLGTVLNFFVHVFSSYFSRARARALRLGPGRNMVQKNKSALTPSFAEPMEGEPSLSPEERENPSSVNLRRCGSWGSRAFLQLNCCGLAS